MALMQTHFFYCEINVIFIFYKQKNVNFFFTLKDCSTMTFMQLITIKYCNNLTALPLILKYI